MSNIYNSTKQRLLQSSMDVDGDTIRVALVDNSVSYTPAIDSEEFVSDVLDGGTTAQELSGTGYSRQTLANATVVQDNTNDRAEFDADDVTWTGLDTTADVQGVLLYKQVGADDSTPGDDPLLGYFDGGDFPISTNGSDFTVSWDAEGIIQAA